MGYMAKVIADSINKWGNRLTTFEVRIPRIVLAEWNTHCMFARNSASSRAIPVEKMINMVLEDPYIPEEFGRNQKGMQAGEALDAAASATCRSEWLWARDSAVQHARFLLTKGVHKQLTNRLLEPFMWHTIINTATDYGNFFHLRNHPMAHPGIATPARMMEELYASSTPVPIRAGEDIPLHLPYLTQVDREELAADEVMGGSTSDVLSGLRSTLTKVSIGKCARVSYLTHDGVRDYRKDVGLHDKLLGNGHMSPTEHVARPMTDEERMYFFRWWTTFDDGTVLPLNKAEDAPPRVGEYLDLLSAGFGSTRKKVTSTRPVAYCGKFNGWIQYRKTLPNEHDFMGKQGG